MEAAVTDDLTARVEYDRPHQPGSGRRVASQLLQPDPPQPALLEEERREGGSGDGRGRRQIAVEHRLQAHRAERREAHAGGAAYLGYHR